MTEKPEKPRVPKWFRFLALSVYVPVFCCLALIGARWYGYGMAAASLAGLIAFRRSRLFHGWRIPACFALAYLVAFTGLFGGPAAAGCFPVRANRGRSGAAVYAPARAARPAGGGA